MNQLKDNLKEAIEKSKSDKWLVGSYSSGTICLQHQCINIYVNINTYDNNITQESRHMTAHQLCRLLNGEIQYVNFGIIEINPEGATNLAILSNGISFSIAGPYFEKERGSGNWLTDYSESSKLLRNCLFNYICNLF